jgi:hypothetical protein
LVLFNPDEDVHALLERGANETSRLTAFFRACADPALGPIASQYTYQEFPRHFVFEEKSKRWKLRKRGMAIGRLYFVSPTAGERFYLRSLLSIVRGPRSFEDLLTYQGRRHSTFREVCLARGLLEDDGEWSQCLEEASHMQTGSQLRMLFAMLLIFCNPTHPDRLWMRFRVHICDDLRWRLQNIPNFANPSDEDVYDYGLFCLNQLLAEHGRNLRNFPPMPCPVRRDWGTVTAEQNTYILNQRAPYQPEMERQAADQCEQEMNADQRVAYNRVVASVRGGPPAVFFLNGPGGTGKTYVYKAICNRIRGDGHIVLCVASSGIAALLLRGGRTAHSMFKIPVEQLHEQSTCSIPKEGQYADMLRQAKLIIWDEVGNQSRFAFEAVDHCLQDIRNDERPFGGLTVVFGGDFQQTLPVVPCGSRAEIIMHSLRRSYLWACIQVLRLRQNMRLEQDADSVAYASWLLEVGQGLSGQTMNIPDGMRRGSLNELIHSIYSGIQPLQPVPPPEYVLDRSILSARNADMDEINDQVLNSLPGQRITFASADSVAHDNNGENDAAHYYPAEYLRSLQPAGLPAGEIHLKQGCPLLLLRNLAPRQGLCNGTRMILRHAGERVLEVQIIGGEHHGSIAFIPRITLTPSSSSTDLSFTLQRRQFPVRLAFAMTINKSQGQSVKWVGLDLRAAVFGHGQLYVALSRATSPHCVKVLLPDDAEGRAANIVYPEVLLRENDDA